MIRTLEHRLHCPRTAARPSTAVRLDTPRHPGRHRTRLRLAAVHHGPRSRTARARAGRGHRCPLRGGCLVWHRRAARRADGARRQAGRRGHHADLLVLCHGRVGGAPGGASGLRRRRSRHPHADRGLGAGRRSRHGRARSSPFTCTGCAPTWTRSLRSPREAGVPSSRMPRRPSARRIAAARRARSGGSLLLVLPEQESRRVRRRGSGDDR